MNIRRLVIGLVTVIGSLGPSLLMAESHNHLSGPPVWAVSGRPADAPLHAPAFNNLYSTIQTRGTVRLIVRLRQTPDLPHGFQPEGLLGKLDRDAQRAAIKRGQDSMLKRIPIRRTEKIKKFDHIPFMAMEVDEAEFLQLLNDPEVDLIEEDVPVPPSLLQSVPLIGADGIGTFSGFTGSGQTVAILDTGVDKTHPILAGKVVSEACYSTTYAGHSATTVCPNGLSEQTGAGAGVNCSTGISGCTHGTHVAGIAAGSGAVNGVAKDASIIAIQVFSRFDSAASCGSSPVPCALTYSSDYTKGLDRVFALRSTYDIAAANMSLGGGSYTANCDASSPSVKAAIDNLRSVGIATVIASGNNGLTNAISAPACISTAISVGATTKADVVAAYSNSASFIKLLAPGSSIFSSTPGANYASWNGTSMATPHVTGAWAVMKSKKPSATVDEVLNAFTATGVSVTDSRNGITKPRINIDSALSQIPVEPRLQFSAVSYTVGEDDGTGTITVRRDISSAGAVSVDWATGNGTATAGSDYTGDSGTVFFADGDMADKTFTVSITDDAVPEGAENFTITLSNPTGGASIGAGSTATVTIPVSDSTNFSHSSNVDILWRNGSTGQNSIWSMNGAVRAATATLDTVPAAWTIGGTADFDGDGNIDILWRNGNTGQNAVWRMNGTARTLPASYLDTLVGSAWKIRGLDDFDKNGSVDILWRNTSTGQVSIWRMNATTRLGITNLTTTGVAWDIVGLADFNGDGFTDILWRNSSTGQNVVWRTNGAATNGAITLETLPVAWKFAGLNDFNNDGKIDIFWRNPSTGQNIVWLMNGTVRSQTVNLSSAGVAWTVAGLKDFNNDGKADILWRNSTSGQNVIWYMNGTSTNGYAYIDTAAVTWGVVAVK